MADKVYLDANGNPIQAAPASGAPAKTYLDDNGNPVSASQPPAQQPGMLDPRGGWSPMDVLRGAGSGIKNFVAHPVDTVAGMAQPFLASGMAPGGMYPTVAATGRPQDSQANAGVQQQAQQGQTAAAQLMAKNPAYAIGSVAGPALLTAGIAKAAPIVGEAIDTNLNPATIKENAGGLLQSVAHDANKVPVQLNNAGDGALALMDWQKKTQLGPTINKFLNRVTNPKQGPLTYAEARDFYQLLGKMSAEESMKLAPAVRRDLVQMVVGLKQDIGDAAEQVGRAADYYNGMKDYARGAKLQEWYDTAKDWGIKAGLGALGAGALGVGARKIYDLTQ